MTLRLEWDGKPGRVERLTLPFQTVETINESRVTRERDAGTLFGGDDSQTTERNSLIWGDNKLVMSSLLKNYAGQVKLVYIDPPFDTGRTDFSFRVSVGDESVDKQPSVLEESAYRDTWGRGRESYLSMMYERIVLIHQLLADDGTMYLHCAPNVSHMLKLVCDEIFGPEHFQNEISWKRASGKNDPNRYGRSHEVLLFYSKGESFTWNVQYGPFEDDYVDENYRYTEDGTGRRYRRGDLTAAKPGGDVDYEWHGARPYRGRHWAYSRENMGSPALDVGDSARRFGV
jgi:adenine specific DNA methylase Mod